MEIPEPVPFCSWHGAQIEGIWGPQSKITMVRQVHLLRFEREDKHALKQRTAREDRVHIPAFVIVRVVGKNSNTPQFESHG